MSPSEPNILQALDVLSEAPVATLLHYKAKLQAVMQKLDDPSLAATPLSPVEELVKILEEELPTIKTRLSIIREIKIRSSEWINEDPRIVDIQISGEQNNSLEAKLRAVLGQRSLAEEFQVWENRYYRNSKGKAEQGKKLGHLNTFLSVNANRFFDHQAARWGVQQGQKLFKCEESLGVGFSAISIFYRRKFRVLNTEQLIDFKRAIKEQHENTTNKKDNSIKQTAEHQEKWLNERQIEYNAWCAKYTKDRTAEYTEDRTAAPTAGRKRVLPSLPVSESKRNKPHKPQGDPVKTVSSSHKENQRKETSLGASATDHLSGPNNTNISSTVALLPAQQTQINVFEQFQQPLSPPHPPPNNVSIQETQRSVLHREEPIRTDVENGPSDGSNAMPSSNPMDPQRHQEQEHIYQYNIEASNLVGTEGQGQTHHMRLDGGQNATSDISPLDVLSQAANDASHQNERHHPAATVQPFLDTSSEQLHGFGIASNQLAINEGRTFDSHSRAAIGDLTRNRILSTNTQSQEDGFQPSRYFYGGNLSFNIQPQDPSTTSEEGSFQPSQYYYDGNPSSADIQPHCLSTASEEGSFQPSQYYYDGNPSSAGIQPHCLSTASEEGGFQPSQYYYDGNPSSADIQPHCLSAASEEGGFQAAGIMQERYDF